MIDYYLCCSKNLPANRNFFIRRLDHEAGQEISSDAYRKCEEEIEYNKYLDRDKLKCLVCRRNLDLSEFGTHQSHVIRNHKGGRCKECKFRYIVPLYQQNWK